MDSARLKQIPLFAQLPDKQLKTVATLADEVQVKEGTQLVDEGRFAHEFFVIEDGTADVVHDGKTVAELGPGDFFGELRALEWGSGYAYPRLASVRATSPLRLLVFPEGSLQELVDRYPPLGEMIRAAVAERLPRHS